MFGIFHIDFIILLWLCCALALSHGPLLFNKGLRNKDRYSLVEYICPFPSCFMYAQNFWQVNGRTGHVPESFLRQVPAENAKHYGFYENDAHLPRWYLHTWKQRIMIIQSCALFERLIYRYLTARLHQHKYCNYIYLISINFICRFSGDRILKNVT